MTWQIAYTRRAHRDLQGLDRVVAARVYAAVVRLADSGQGDVRRLRGYSSEWRLRVGDWRVRLTYDYSSGVVTVSIRHASSNVFPRSMLLSDATDTCRFSAAPWPAAHALRPVCALDALLQSSHALLL